MVTPNLKPWFTDDDIEAQLQDDFTHEATRRRMGPDGVLRWGFDKAHSSFTLQAKALDAPPPSYG
jgi:hypothetical protein